MIFRLGIILGSLYRKNIKHHAFLTNVTGVLVGGLDGWLAGNSAGGLAGWPAGWLDSWMAGRLAGGPGAPKSNFFRREGPGIGLGPQNQTFLKGTHMINFFLVGCTLETPSKHLQKKFSLQVPPQFSIKTKHR